jgi:hypothetical protein
MRYESITSKQKGSRLIIVYVTPGITAAPYEPVDLLYKADEQLVYQTLWAAAIDSQLGSGFGIISELNNYT